MQTRAFGRQLFVALRHLHACEHIHADIKPDNILIGGEKRNLLKLGDFGTAIPLWEAAEYKASRYIQSRYYRAPEVPLGFTRTPAMDVWSAGCVLFELYTGQFVFYGDNNLEMLRSMATVLGPIPPRIARSSPNRHMYFLPDRDVLMPPPVSAADESKGAGSGAAPQLVGPGFTDIRSRLTRAAVKGKVRAVKAKHPRNAAKIEAARTLTDAEKADIACLADLLEKIFVYDAGKRFSAEQALRHDFFREALPAKAK